MLLDQMYDSIARLEVKEVSPWWHLFGSVSDEVSNSVRPSEMYVVEVPNVFPAPTATGR